MTNTECVLVLFAFWPVFVIGGLFVAWLIDQRKLRFSLRDMLIAFTVVACLLGLLASIARNIVG